VVLVSLAGGNRGRDFLAPSVAVFLAVAMLKTTAAAQTASSPQQVEAAQPPLPAIRVVGRRATRAQAASRGGASRAI